KLGDTNGHLDFEDWAVTLNEDKLTPGTIDPTKLGELTNTAYHEARHGEQWYQMARHLAEGGTPPSKIAQELDIPQAVAEQAAKEPKMSPQQAADAAKYYDSVYGQGAAHRNQVLGGLDTLPQKVEAARIEYQRVEHDPSVPMAEKQAKFDAWLDAYNKAQQNYQDYRNLPAEADAWATGDAVAAAFETSKADTTID